jgi:hypothetical protein
MKLYPLTLIFSLSIAAGSALAAPLCSQVLQSHGKLTASAIEQTIQSITELRFRLDIAQSQGPLTTATRGMKSEYKIKLQELIHSLQGKLSEQEIHTLISQKISQIQKVSEKVIEQEKKVRANEKVPAPPSTYQLENEIFIFEEKIGKKIRILSDPDGDSFLYQGQNSDLNIFTFQNQKKRTHSLNLRARVFETDGTQIVGISTRTDAIFTYDIQSKAVSNSIPLSPDPGTKWESMELNSEKNLVLIKGSVPGSDLFKASIYNLKTGEEIFNQQKITAMASPTIFSIQELRILDDKHVLAVINSELLQRIEIATGKIVESVPVDGGPSGNDYQIALSADRSIGALFMSGRRMSFDPYNLTNSRSEKNDSNITPAFDDRIHELSDGASNLGEAFGIRSFAGATIIDMRTLNESFDFQKMYHHESETNRALAATISADRKKILILCKGMSGQTLIDVWTLVP